MQKPAEAKEPHWRILKLIRWTTSYFNTHRVESPRASAEILLAHTLGLARIDLYLRYDQPLVEEELKRFKQMIKKRIAGEPVAYIVGIKEFWSLELEVSPDVLIPRPETECVVEAVQRFLTQAPNRSGRRILDLGTGSGAIIIALASVFPDNRYFALDRGYRISALARQNARRNDLKDRIHFFVADWFEALKSDRSGFDIIISNPPYIQSDAIRHLQPEISKYEPGTALDGGPDGLDCLRHIIRRAHHFLAAEGRLFLEIGSDQKAAVGQIIDAVGGYTDVIFSEDYSGLDRVVQMEKEAHTNAL